MVTQKAMIAVMIVWLASSIASLLKFAERKQLNGFAVIVSLLTPLFLLVFMAQFSLYAYREKFTSFALPKKIFAVISFAIQEIQIVPLMHTTVINWACSAIEARKSKSTNHPMKGVPVRVAIENLHWRIFSSSPIA